MTSREDQLQIGRKRVKQVFRFLEALNQHRNPAKRRLDVQLAIECDGDRYHPIEMLPEDMARQAVLERLGWTFVRLRGSQFFRSPDKTMTPLLQQLKVLGIEPMGNADSQREGAEAIGCELRDRVVRRGQEIRRHWEPDSNSRTEGAEQELATQDSHPTRRPMGADTSTAAAATRACIYADQAVTEAPTGVDSEEQLPLFDRTVSDRDVRAAIHKLVLASGRIELETLVLRVGQTLGFQIPSKPLSIQIHRIIGGEAGSGRLDRDDNWNYVWHHKS